MAFHLLPVVVAASFGSAFNAGDHLHEREPSNALARESRGGVGEQVVVPGKAALQVRLLA
jgi:hypothetical protein